MEISITCETFARLAKISRANEAGILRSIWLETLQSGDVIAVSTNRKVAAFEHIGRATGEPGGMNVTVCDALLKQVETEVAFASSVVFVNNPMLRFVSAKTSLGFVLAENAGVYASGANPFETWRKWWPDTIPTAPNGGIFSTLENLALLASAAPTGAVVFQEIIDNKQPVIVQDIHETGWYGLFMPRPDAQNRSPEPLAIPGWVR